MRSFKQFAETVVSRLRRQDELRSNSTAPLQPVELTLQTLEERVLYSAVPLPVDLADAVVDSPDAEFDPSMILDSADVEASLDQTFNSINDTTVGDEFVHDLSLRDSAQNDVLSMTDTTTFLNAEGVDLDSASEADKDHVDRDGGSSENLTATPGNEPSDENGRSIDTPVRAARVVAVSPNNGSVVSLVEGDFLEINDLSLSTSGLPDGESYRLGNDPDNGTLYGSSGKIQGGDEISVEQLRNQEIVFVPDANFAGSETFTFEAVSDGALFTVEAAIEGAPDDGIATAGDRFSLTGSETAVSATGERADITVLENGNYVVTWVANGSGPETAEVFVAVYAPDGTVVRAPLRVSDGDNEGESAEVAALDDGGFVVAWQDQAGVLADVNLQRFDANGDRTSLDGNTPGVDRVRVTALFSAHENPTIVGTSDGGFAVAYQAQVLGDPIEESNAVVKIFNADGDETKEVVVSGFTEDLESRPEIVVLQDGKIVVAWLSEDSGRVQASILNPNGDTIRSSFVLDNSLEDVQFSMAATKDNGFVVVWQNRLTAAGKILGLVYDNAGEAITSPTTLQERSASGFGAPDVVVLNDGSMVVGFNDDFGNGQTTVGQRFDSRLNVVGELFSLTDTTTEEHSNISLALLGDGKLIAAADADDGSEVGVVTNQAVMALAGFEDSEVDLNLVAGVHPSAQLGGDPALQEGVFNTFLRGLPAGTRVLVDGTEIGFSDGSNDIVITGQPMDRVSIIPPAGVGGAFDAQLAVVTQQNAVNREVVSAFRVELAPAPSPISVSGVVAHDDEIDGLVVGDDGIANVNVHLIVEETDGVYRLGASTVTDANGAYSFNALVEGQEYIVIVDSKSIALAGETVGETWAQQTFSSAGGLTSSFFTDGAVTLADGYLIGGANGNISDEFSVSALGLNIQNAQHGNAFIASATNMSLASRDFGFNFNVVNHVGNGATAVGGPGQVSQGSLHQFLLNANAIDGQNEMVFVPTVAPTDGPSAGVNDRWTVSIDSLLPMITDDLTVIDGQAWKAPASGFGALERNNLNEGNIVGIHNGDVGVSIAKTGAASQPNVGGIESPDLEIVAATEGLTYGLMASASNENQNLEGVAIRNIAIHGFGEANTGSGNIIVDGTGESNSAFHKVSSFELSGSVIGTSVDPIFDSSFSNDGVNILVLSASSANPLADNRNIISNNLIANADLTGIRFSLPLMSGSSRHWSVVENVVANNGIFDDGSSDGIDVGRGTSDISVTNNFIDGNGAYGVDTFLSDGSLLISGNTISNNGLTSDEKGGIRLFGDGSTIFGNVISDNAGPGINVAGRQFVNAAAQENRISTNEFSNNAGISIDLAADFSTVPTQDLGDGVTVIDGQNEDSGNRGIDAPVIVSVSELNNELLFSFEATGSLADVNSNGALDSNEFDSIEIYYASPGVGDTIGGESYGEGAGFIASITGNDLVLDGSVWKAVVAQPALGWPVVEFVDGDSITSIVIDEANNTSEFSKNVEINFAPNGVDAFYDLNEDESRVFQVSNFHFEDKNVADQAAPEFVRFTRLPIRSSGEIRLNGVAVTVNQEISRAQIEAGALTFQTVENFNGNFTLGYQVSDGELFGGEANVVGTIAPVNDAPTLEAISLQTVDEYQTISIDVQGVGSANDVDGDVLTTIITGGADAGLFGIDAATSQLFLRDGFALTNGMPVDLQVNVAVDDGNGGMSAEQTVTVRVANVNDAPTLGAVPVQTGQERETTSIDVLALGGAADLDGDTLLLEIVGGTDAGLFEVDSITNQLVLTNGFVLPDGNSAALNVDVLVSDGNGGQSDVQSIVLNVENVNDAPTLEAISLQTVNEYQTISIDVQTLGNASDQDGDALTTIITGGADAGLFGIDAATSQLFLRDGFTLTKGMPVDLQVNVAAEDGNGGMSAEQTVTVRVSNENDAPTLGAIPVQTVLERETTSIDVLPLGGAADLDGDAMLLEIVGGADAGLFEIDSATNHLVLSSGYVLPDGNVVTLNVDVVASDENGGQSEVQSVALNVENVNDAPVIEATPESRVVSESDRRVIDFSASDQDGDQLTYSLTDKPDNQFFEINERTGVLRFKEIPNFQSLRSRGEQPFDVEIKVDDGNSGTEAPTRSIRVEIENFVVPATVNPENSGESSSDGNGDVSLSIDPQQLPPSNATVDRGESVNRTTPVRSVPINASSTNALDEENNSFNPSANPGDQSLVDLMLYESRYETNVNNNVTQLVSQQLADVYKNRRSTELIEVDSTELASLFWRELDSSNQDYLQRALEVDTSAIITASTGLLSLSFVGLLYGSGVAITTLATQLPAWKSLDISPLISAFDEDEETIHQIVDG